MPAGSILQISSTRIRMAAPTKAQVTGALARTIQDALKQGEAVRIEGLGTFRLHHQISQIERSPDGQIVMKPPRDVIAFSSDE